MDNYACNEQDINNQAEISMEEKKRIQEWLNSKGKSLLDKYLDTIVKDLKAQVYQQEIIRHITKLGYSGKSKNAQMYIKRFCNECDIVAPKYIANKKSPSGIQTNEGFISEKQICEYIRSGKKISQKIKDELHKTHAILLETYQFVRLFEEVFRTKSMVKLYLFIEKYENHEHGKLCSFIKGLKRDIKAVENAVSSEKSNGFVEGINNKIKTIKRTMYGRFRNKLLMAKLMYNKW